MDETVKKKFKRNSIEGRKEEKLPSWSELPCPVLEKIFSFLSHRDRDQMSLVCHKWLEESRSPSLWRRTRFCFQEPSCSFLDAEIKIVKKYGRMFRHLDIVFEVGKGVNKNRKLRQLSLFLQELRSNSLLQTIKLICIKIGSWLNDRCGSDCIFFLLCLKNLLKAQVQLQSLEFSGSFFKVEDCLDILEAAFTNNAGNLKRLVLRNFVRIPITPTEFKITFIHLMANLESFQTDYDEIFERIIYGLQQHSIAGNKGSNCRLHEIKLNCNLMILCFGRYEDERYRGISSSVWKQLRKISPKLNVTLYISAFESYRDDIEFFFKPGMPLKSLILELYKIHDNFEYLLGYFLTTSMNEYLEYLSIIGRDWMPYSQPKIAEFLLACQKLENFNLDIRHPATGLEELFRAWVTERPASLKKITVTISSIETEEDVCSYKHMADFYINQLSDTGLLLCFNTNFD